MRPSRKIEKLSERLSAFNPKTITDMVINAVQSSKSAGFAPKQFRPSQFYGKPRVKTRNRL